MSPPAEMQAVVDFDCLDQDCSGNVVFDLLALSDADGAVTCPECHHPYQFDRAFVEKLQKLRKLVMTVRECEGILGDCNVAVTTPAGEVKIPYRLLLTRLNTLISLDVSGRTVDFNFRVEPLNDASFR